MQRTCSIYFKSVLDVNKMRDYILKLYIYTYILLQNAATNEKQIDEEFCYLEISSRPLRMLICQSEGPMFICLTV